MKNFEYKAYDSSGIDKTMLEQEAADYYN